MKDIKSAILAADIIVNEWGFKEYQLDIFGDEIKAPAYSVECKEILASKGLRDYVTLRGLGKPSQVLETAVSTSMTVLLFEADRVSSGSSSTLRSQKVSHSLWERLR